MERNKPRTRQNNTRRGAFPTSFGIFSLENPLEVTNGEGPKLVRMAVCSFLL